MNETYYDSGLIESKEIEEDGERKLVVFDENGKCIYSSSKEYESESILRLHKDHYKVEN